MSDDELQSVRKTKNGEKRYPSGVDIMSEGDPNPGIHTIFSGWAFRYMTLRSGVRQILDIMLPGDLIGLQPPMMGKIRHSIRTVTEVRVCSLDSAHFHNLFKIHEALSEALIATLMEEEHRSDVRLLLLGRQRPAERLGYFLLELRERLQRRGENVDRGFDLPLTYAHLADTIGTSRSQLGSSLQDLHTRNWAMLSGRQLTFMDTEAMEQGCEYSHLPDPKTRTLI